MWTLAPQKLMVISFFVYSLFAWATPAERLERLPEQAPPEYTPDYIQKKVEITGRNFYDYLRRLGFDENEVLLAKGQKWLSVGEGKSDFTKEAFGRGIDSWALDAVVKNPHAPERSLIGLAQKLPFGDKEFDRVVSVWLVDSFFNTQSFNDPETGKSAILEMIRVTKIGGDIRINPVSQSAIFTVLNELKNKQLIHYEILPYYVGHFKTEGKRRAFFIEPAQDKTPGSVKIVRLK